VIGMEYIPYLRLEILVSGDMIQVISR